LECGGLPPLFFHPQPEPAQIQASSPPSVTSGVVNLTAYFQNGWLAIAPDAFSYGPQILQLLPNAGTNTGGDSVQIYGYGFGSDPTKITVEIGGANATVQKVEGVTSIASSLGLDAGYPFSLERITLQPPWLFGEGRRFRFDPCGIRNFCQIISVLAECSIARETWFLQVPAVRSETAASLFNEQRTRRYF